MSPHATMLARRVARECVLAPALAFACALALLPGAAGAAGAAGTARAGSIQPSLARAAEASPEARVRVWVLFADRAGAERDPGALAAERARRPSASLERRRLRGAIRDIVASDLPVHAPYVRALEARGAVLRGTSRWLNAASVEIPAGRVPSLARLPFVERVERVPRARPLRPAEPFLAETEAGQTPPAPRAPAPAPAAVAPAPVTLAPGDPSFYGPTFKQLDLMQVPAMHSLGLNGQGVLVCILDSGFRTIHQALTNLQVLATRDFVHGDTTVDDEPGQDDPGEASHGTYTTACIAGFLPGTYVGGAYGAMVALGKTEDVTFDSTGVETPVEMDYWQFGAEWADSLGAAVLSSSLGYSEFDDPADSYDYADMDGRTTVVTRAASEAVRRGITVVTAAGNAGATPWHYIIAPADADTVLAAGAVDSFNVVTAFSSRGPSADGRVKPDLTAMGRSVYVPSFSSATTFGRVSGTSFSTPLTAGLVALLLENHPTWGPFEVREALRETALNHGSPNNDIGWGLVQGLDALLWVPSTTGADPAPESAPSVALAASPNPFPHARGTTIRFTATGPVALDAHDARGRRVARLFEGTAAGATSVLWRGTSDAGRLLAPGVYWVRLSAAGAADLRTESRRVVLLP